MVFMYIFFIILISSIVQGASSFGFAIVAMPFLELFLPVKTATILVLILDALLVFFISLKMRKHIVFKSLIYVILGSYLGVIIGVFGLENLKSGSLEMILGILLIIISLYLIFNDSFQIKPSKFNGISSGLIS
ncbi:MAG TPA: TSUP family transporter [Halanaerobiales bacterium]|nr:TSUP family transporter [Halanaerobiales bacterium]